MKKIINWGIIAPGSIAEKFASDLRLVEDANLLAIGSRDINRSKSFAQKHKAAKAYGSYEELVKDPEVDVVYIASPHTFHYEQTLLCLENNKHVLVEKPMGMNSREVEAMRDLASKKGLFLMEAFWTRFIPSYLKCRELIENGTIGDIRFIQSDFGFRTLSDSKSRLLNKDLGGGALLDIGIYPVFLALSLLGKPEKIIADGLLGETGVDLTNAIIFKYNSLGAMATLSSTIATSTPVESIISGTKGRIKILRHWHTPTSLELIIDDKVETFNFEDPGFGYEYEAREVNACLKQGKTESELFSLKDSLLLHTTLDTIRKQIGLKYKNDI